MGKIDFNKAVDLLSRSSAQVGLGGTTPRGRPLPGRIFYHLPLVSQSPLPRRSGLFDSTSRSTLAALDALLAVSSLARNARNSQLLHDAIVGVDRDNQVPLPATVKSRSGRSGPAALLASPVSLVYQAAAAAGAARTPADREIEWQCRPLGPLR